MAEPTSYVDPPEGDKPTRDFCAKVELLFTGRYPRAVVQFERVRPALDGNGDPDTNALGLPLYQETPLGGAFSVEIDSRTPAGLQRLGILMDTLASTTAAYIASGNYPSIGVAYHAALADTAYGIRTLLLEQSTASAIAALGFTAHGDHPFKRSE